MMMKLHSRAPYFANALLAAVFIFSIVVLFDCIKVIAENVFESLTGLQPLLILSGCCYRYNAYSQ